MSPLFTAGETKVSTSATFAPKSEVWNSPVGHGMVSGGRGSGRGAGAWQRLGFYITHVPSILNMHANVLSFM